MLLSKVCLYWSGCYLCCWILNILQIVFKASEDFKPMKVYVVYILLGALID